MEDMIYDINELMKVESMPKIFFQLELIGKAIDKELKGVDKMECTEKNKIDVKKRKQDITALKKIMEERRIAIKKQILEPYNIFNEKYEKEILTKLEHAEETLKEKYTLIENTQKQEKENELRRFVEEHCKANNVEIPFEKIGLNITLSASEKSLKEQAKAFIERVASDINLINMESQYKDEILLEYQNDYDYVVAKTKVLDRHKQLDDIHMKMEEINNAEEQDQKVIEKVDEATEITAPVEVVDEEETKTYQFTVKATDTQIKKLIEFMKELGISYE